ncbi:error-prone DNA polymerase [Verrucomicrobia bacterium LW23]|nr:error-prone DNA polymerase [Verrucomicrobia bacterium LW23]
MSYIELHARSAFSFLRGASQPELMADIAASTGYGAMALCDRNGVYGAARYFTRAQEKGLCPLVGCELTLEGGHVLPVLVSCATGYRNLCEMLTRAQLRAPKGESRILWSELEEFREGLIALTGDAEGPLYPAVCREDRNRAEATLRRIVRAFGPGNVYVELQRHRVPGEDSLCEYLLELARAQGVPVVATNGVAYAEPAGRDVLDIFTCILHHTHLDAAGLLLSKNAQRYIKSPDEMAELFADIPEAIANTERIAERLEFTLSNLGYEFPDFPVPDGGSMDGYLRRHTYEGARRLYGAVTRQIEQQLDKELALIAKLGFSGYFLIVWDIVRFAQSRGIMVQGRGSAANSAVCYCLGITKVDPIGNKLLFERFLSEGRKKSWPDIDLDLPSGELRETIIQEVFNRYSRHGAAMMANVITYRGRSAMREIGKALNFSADYLGRFSDLFANGDFTHTLEIEKQIAMAGLSRTHPRFRPAVDLYQRIKGLPRHLGQHSGGMVICKGRLDHVVPLENASMPNRTVVQWDKDDCEDLGIIKIDFLGLGMMAVMQEVVTLCAQRGHAIDIARLPMDDAATYDLMQRADTVGTFQVESRAQMATLPRLKPRNFYDVAIQVAIVRPGPIVGQLVHPYIARRNGKQQVDYIHPDLQPILERTLGVILFQEQMLSIAMKMADFDGGEAEELRRAISFHRDPGRLKRVVERMRSTMMEKNIAQDVQEKILDSLRSFALYGFPESHALSFALLAYASCWLKVHRAPEFYCALLNNQPMGFYSPATLMKDGKRHGITFRPVCVVRSGEKCTVEQDNSIRLGLNYMQGLHRENAARIIAERNARSFAGLHDFLRRVPLSKAERRSLAKTGALNQLSKHRRTALWEVESLFAPDDLFSTSASPSATEAADGESHSPSPLAPMHPLERLQADFDGTGVTTGTHPMRFLRAKLPHITLATNLPLLSHGDKVTIAGLVICRQRPGTAKGHVFISLEDETGIANAFVHSTLFEKCRMTITHEPFLEILGHLQHIDGVISVLARKIIGLSAPVLLSNQSHDFH